MIFRRHFSLVTALLLSCSGAAFAESSSEWTARNPHQSGQFIAQQLENSASPRAKGHHRGGGKDRLMEQLDLTEAQQEELQSIRSRYQPQMEGKHEELRAAHNRLREMLAGDSSTSVLRTQHQQVLNLRQDLAEMRFASMLEVREVLTSAQRQEWSELMEQHQQNRRNRRPQ